MNFPFYLLFSYRKEMLPAENLSEVPRQLACIRGDPFPERWCETSLGSRSIEKLSSPSPWHIRSTHAAFPRNGSHHWNHEAWSCQELFEVTQFHSPLNSKHQDSSKWLPYIWIILSLLKILIERDDTYKTASVTSPVNPQTRLHIRIMEKGLSSWNSGLNLYRTTENLLNETQGLTMVSNSPSSSKMQTNTSIIGLPFSFCHPNPSRTLIPWVSP